MFLSLYEYKRKYCHVNKKFFRKSDFFFKTKNVNKKIKSFKNRNLISK